MYLYGRTDDKRACLCGLGVDESADFSELSLAFRNLREKYHPDKNPAFRKEYAEALAAFELLQRDY